MFGLLQIYILLNLYFILIKCVRMEDLSVRIIDKKLIQKQRQDTRDMCNIFNSEAPKAGPPVEALPANKYDKRKKELKLKEKKEEIQNKTKHRIRRAIANGVETKFNKINDGMPKKGQKTASKRNVIPRATTKDEAKGFDPTAKKSGRRFPFAPNILDGRTTTIRNELDINDDLPSSTEVRFKNAVLPYFIDSKTYDNQLTDIIIKAFDYFEKTTCIRLQRLRERPTDAESLKNVLWLYITNPAGIRQCVHSNERAVIQGVQLITFGYDCMSQGDIAHEIMHVLGFAHEHVRHDRDQHITILWDNIKPGYMQYFELHKNETIVENLPYDYASVLHYPPRAFSKNGKVTILTENGIKIGQREGLSEMDVEKVGILYSNECIRRNREYMTKTCPVAAKAQPEPAHVSDVDIDNYFADKRWPYGVVQYKFKLPVEFSTEEIDNINAVIKHIQKETCLQFREIIPDKNNPNKTQDNDNSASMQQSDSSSSDSSSSDNSSSDSSSESSSSSINFNTEELDKLVILNSGERYVMNEPSLQNSSSEEYYDGIMPLDDKIETKSNVDDENFLFDFNNARKGKHNSGLSGTGVKGNYTKYGIKGKGINVGTKGNVINVGANGSHTNVGNKVKTTDDITFRKAADLRRKRAVAPTPTRRHSASILVLARSPQPGCACPQTGKPNGTYEFSINADCFNTVNDLLHVFGHVLGLDHQHNMHDRDSYLHIELNQLTDDIRKEMEEKLPPVASLGLPYDYQSVMHYPWLQIKKGMSNIIYPIWNDGWAMGHWQGLSTIDVRKIQIIYSKNCFDRIQQEAYEEKKNNDADKNKDKNKVDEADNNNDKQEVDEADNNNDKQEVDEADNNNDKQEVDEADRNNDKQEGDVGVDLGVL